MATRKQNTFRVQRRALARVLFLEWMKVPPTVSYTLSHARELADCSVEAADAFLARLEAVEQSEDQAKSKALEEENPLD